jgi:hypothetical protein
MGYTVENKQDAVVKSVLQTTEQTFASSKIADQVVVGQASKQTNPEVYFQIED